MVDESTTASEVELTTSGEEAYGTCSYCGWVRQLTLAEEDKCPCCGMQRHMPAMPDDARWVLDNGKNDSCIVTPEGIGERGFGSYSLGSNVDYDNVHDHDVGDAIIALGVSATVGPGGVHHTESPVKESPDDLPIPQ